MGLAPLRRSAEALPIACDAFNARTMAVRKYHYVFCALSPAVCYICFAAWWFARCLSSRRKVMAHPPYGSAKERIRFALYCAAAFLRRFLFKVQNGYAAALAAERKRGVKTFHRRLRLFLCSEIEDSHHQFGLQPFPNVVVYAKVATFPCSSYGFRMDKRAMFSL